MLRLPWRAATTALRLPGLRSRGMRSHLRLPGGEDDVLRRRHSQRPRRRCSAGCGCWRRLRRSRLEACTPRSRLHRDRPSGHAGRQAASCPRGGPHYMPLDLAVQSIPSSAAGVKPTIAVVEGVTMYLEEQQVARLLGSLAAPGNRLVVNFGVGGGKTRHGRRAVRAAASAGGEALRFRAERGQTRSPCSSGPDGPHRKSPRVESREPLSQPHRFLGPTHERRVSHHRTLRLTPASVPAFRLAVASNVGLRREDSLVSQSPSRLADRAGAPVFACGLRHEPIADALASAG